jgi:sulfatase modifying factor 1
MKGSKMYRLFIFSLIVVCLCSCENQEMKMTMDKIKSDPKNFYQLPKAFQMKKEIALLALEKKPAIYKDLDDVFKTDEAFVIEAIKRNLNVYQKLPYHLKENRNIIKAFEDVRNLEIEGFKKYGIEMVFIRVGWFMMGSPDGPDVAKPVHKVKVKNFYISKTEVTVAQYRQCVDAGECPKPRDKNSYQHCNWGYDDRDDHPMNCIDWQEARTFAKWVGADLPSEAQWEYASKSKDEDHRYPWGQHKANCEYAVMHEGEKGCGQKGTLPVCSKQKGNTLQGLCDMSGNVWEWILDEWHLSYRGAPELASAWCSTRKCKNHYPAERVRRGGGWRDQAKALRSAYREGFSSDLGKSDLGFRISKRSKAIISP